MRCYTLFCKDEKWPEPPPHSEADWWSAAVGSISGLMGGVGSMDLCRSDTMFVSEESVLFVFALLKQQPKNAEAFPSAGANKPRRAGGQTGAEGRSVCVCVGETLWAIEAVLLLSKQLERDDASGTAALRSAVCSYLNEPKSSRYLVQEAKSHEVIGGNSIVAPVAVFSVKNNSPSPLWRVKNHSYK